jgi:hypothetical protein
MPKPDHGRPSEPPAERAELVQLVGRIKALTLELQEPRRRELDQADVEAKERLLEQLRWRLAAVARRAATEELGNAVRAIVRLAPRMPVKRRLKVYARPLSSVSPCVTVEAWTRSWPTALIGPSRAKAQPEVVASAKQR